MLTADEISAALNGYTPKEAGTLPVVVKTASGVRILGDAHDIRHADVIALCAGVSGQHMSLAQLETTGQRFFVLHG